MATEFDNYISVKYFYMGPDGPIPIPGKLLSVHAKNGNAEMICADIAGHSEKRYRDCIEPDCTKTFRKPHEAEYRCESCRARVQEMERRNAAGNDLQRANQSIKPWGLHGA